MSGKTNVEELGVLSLVDPAGVAAMADRAALGVSISSMSPTGLGVGPDDSLVGLGVFSARLIPFGLGVVMAPESAPLGV